MRLQLHTLYSVHPGIHNVILPRPTNTFAKVPCLSIQFRDFGIEEKPSSKDLVTPPAEQKKKENRILNVFFRKKMGGGGGESRL